MGAGQISEQVGRVPCPCSGQWETIGHHRVTLACRLAREVLPPASKGLFCCKGGYCCCYCFQLSSNVTYKAIPALLPHLAGCASAKQQSACKEKALWWKTYTAAVRLGGDRFGFSPPQWLKSPQPWPELGLDVVLGLLLGEVLSGKGSQR